MYQIELPAGIQGDMTFAMFSDLCEHFNCSLEGKTRSGSWIIESEDAANFYWLGANMALRINTPLSVSIAEKIASGNNQDPVLNKY